MVRFTSWVLAFSCLYSVCEAFVPRKSSLLDKSAVRFNDRINQKLTGSSSRRSVALRMGLDLATYLRTEWVAAALCTNQTPSSADVCLQLGVEDGRAVSFIPRTVRELITSSAEEDGCLTVTARRQLKQQQERRQASTVTYIDQPADNLRETADESVDVVFSLMAAERMLENGLDWKKSIEEAGRVLKPGGRFLFVEQTEVEGITYTDVVENVIAKPTNVEESVVEQKDGEEPLTMFLFDDVGWDDIELCIVPHRAGVAIKAIDAGMSPSQISEKRTKEEADRKADLAIEAYERGFKKRKRKKKKKETKEDENANASA